MSLGLRRQEAEEEEEAGREEQREGRREAGNNLPTIKASKRERVVGKLSSSLVRHNRLQ